MDLVIGLLWCLAFSVIVLFLGALNYFLGQTHSDINIAENKSQSNTTNQQQQSNPGKNSNNRRKHARNANKKRQQAAAVAMATNETLINEDKQEIESISSEINIEKEESTIQLLDEEQEQNEEFKDPMTTVEEVLTHSPLMPIQDEQKPILPIKQRHKNKSNSINSKSSKPSISLKDESILPIKPQASVAPVKQPVPLMQTVNIEYTQNHQDNNSKSNGKLSSSSTCNIYSYTEQNSIPPRFQQQRYQQKEINDVQRFRRRRTTKKSSIPLGSAGRQNDFVPSISKQPINNNNNELSNQNGYSSESDILTELSLATPPLSTESQYLLKRSDIKRSISPSNIFLDELVSIFDTTSFSADELELILNKITTKHLSNKQDRQRLSSTTNDKTIERILDETCRSQAKILAIELQTEKNRVLELSKVNAEMDNTIRQLQQPNNNMLPYQQTILSYQMQIRRVTDENARLVHQLHAYSIMPASINELKQQQIILNEQLRQIMFKNSNLEKESADGERATKHAAEIYKKADIQKQERIDQMMIDINKYKKIDKDLSALQEKHNELEKSLNLKLNNITQQRDDLQKTCDKLKEKVQEYEQMKQKYDQLNENQTKTTNINELQQELNEAKAKNDLLRQRNWKIMEQLNKLTHK